MTLYVQYKYDVDFPIRIISFQFRAIYFTNIFTYMTIKTDKLQYTHLQIYYLPCIKPECSIGINSIIPLKYSNNECALD